MITKVVSNQIYKGFQIEACAWSPVGLPAEFGFHSRQESRDKHISFNGYLYIYSRQVPENERSSFFELREHRFPYDHFGLEELPFHGGITFMQVSRNPLSSTLKIGCDYGHADDIDDGGWSQRTVSIALSDMKCVVDAIPRVMPWLQRLAEIEAQEETNGN